MPEATTIRAGFVPLIDSSLLVVAREIGFAAEHGIDLQLFKEISWATIRDRIAVGHFDVAQMLAPMPIAANLGLTPFADAMIAPMALGAGGNGITVSTELFDEIGTLDDLDPHKCGTALRDHIQASREDKKLRFAVVHPHSAHNFELRYWLAACGINPETDVQIEILPPSFMSDALASGTIDGFCVGEPWNSVAVSRGAGRIVTTKSRIWASSPEKVLGVRQSWADDNGDILAALIRALQEAAVWCEDNANRKALAVLLARPEYIGIEARTIERALNGDAHFSANSGGATFPWKSHALWLYTQMVRWGQVQHTGEAVELAKATYRPDIYRAALEATETAVPAANSKVEGALTIPTVVGAGRSMLEIGPDGFFDGLIFDPDDIDGYIARQSQSPLPKNYTTV